MVIKIGHINYKVRFKPKVGLGDYTCKGYIQYDTEEIFIATKYPKKKAEILLHEVIHAIDEFAFLKLTERQVTALATGLLMVFRDNKKFLSSIK